MFSEKEPKPKEKPEIEMLTQEEIDMLIDSVSEVPDSDKKTETGEELGPVPEIQKIEFAPFSHSKAEQKEPPLEAEAEQEKPSLEIEKEVVLPWAKMEKEEEEKLIAKYAEQSELSSGIKKFAGEALRKEIEEKKIEFARTWFDEHGDILRDEGIPLDISEEKKVSIAIERGALKELKTKEEYGWIQEQIDDLNALRIDLEKKDAPIESQILVLNFLGNKLERIKEEMEEAKAEGKVPHDILTKKKSLEDFYDAAKELAEKVSGRNFKKEADEVISITPKDAYLRERFEDRFNELSYSEGGRVFREEWERLSDAERAEVYGGEISNFVDEKTTRNTRVVDDVQIGKRSALALFVAGYNPSEFRLKPFTGWFTGKIELKTGEIIHRSQLSSFVEKKTREFTEKIGAAATKDLSERWEKEYQKLVRVEIENKIMGLAKTPEQGIGIIDEMYQKVKDRVIIEYIEKDLKKEPKTREQLNAIEKQFGKKGENPIEFLADARSLQRELNGDINEDADNLSELFSHYGIGIEPENLLRRINPEAYAKSVGRERGFLEWIIDLLFGLTAPVTEEPSKRSGRPRRIS